LLNDGERGMLGSAMIQAARELEYQGIAISVSSSGLADCSVVLTDGSPSVQTGLGQLHVRVVHGVVVL
jgi:hypothetical protein